MGTKDFNVLDKIIAWTRLGRVVAHIAAGDRVLDFGCGHQAYLLRHIQDKVIQGVGLDYDSPSRKVASNIEVINFHFKNKLPLESKSFDKVVLLAVLEHLSPEVASNLFKEIDRIMTSKGKIILTTPTPWGKVILEFLAFRLGVISAKEVADHKKYYSKRELHRFAKEHHYIIEEYKTFQLGGNSICVMRKENK